MSSTAHRKQQALDRARVAYLECSTGLTDSELGSLLGVSTASACRYRHDLGCTIVAPGRYRYVPTSADRKLAALIIAYK